MQTPQQQIITACAERLVDELGCHLILREYGNGGEGLASLPPWAEERIRDVTMAVLAEAVARMLPDPVGGVAALAGHIATELAEPVQELAAA